jgi:hypothetical protein
MPDKKLQTIAFTIIAQNYYPQAAVLASSFKKNHPNDPFFVFFVDNKPIKSSDYIGVSIKDVTFINNIEDLSFKYNITEFSTAVKPGIFLWLFKKYKPKNIIYLDPDICIYKNLNLITETLKLHDCVLIPHRTKPTDDDKKPNEWDFMACGYYNLGFVAFKNTPKVIKFIDWWNDKLQHYAYSDTKNLMFTDQKWMDYAPSFLDTYIIKDQGYDVAYWNLHEYFNHFNPKDVVFFHFSGFIPEKSLLSKHQDRFSLQGIGDYKKLFDDYTRDIDIYKAKQPDLSNYIYPYGHFDNNVEITQSIRDIYRYLSSNEKHNFKDPFSTKSSKSFLSYLCQPNYIAKNLSIINYFLLLNKTIDKIPDEFNIQQPYTKDAIFNFLVWCLNFSKSIYKTPDFFLLLQKKYTPRLGKIKFSPKQNLHSIDIFTSLENSKRQKNNSAFIVDAYQILLHRVPDQAGYQKNLNDLNSKKIPRSFFVFRMLNSQEFFYKYNQTFFNNTYLYKYWLLFISFLYFIFLRAFSFKKFVGFKPARRKNFSKELGWNISGYLNTESGVGESARGLINAFKASKVPIHLNNIDQPWLRQNDLTYAHKFSQKHNYDINLICVNADQLKLTIENKFSKEYTKNKYNIGYWYWESNIFPEKYQEAFDIVNEVWTATSFVQQAISLKSNKPVICIPPSFTLPSTSTIQNFDFAKYKIKTFPQDFVFLNIFDSASFWQRKNPFGLIEAFSSAFKDQKNIKLIIKTTKIQKTDIYPELKKTIEQNPQILLIDTYLSSQEILSLIKSSSCYVSLHRAEGLGIPSIYSHLLNKPVIATNFSGNTDFETQDNTFLVNYEPYILTENIGPYPKNTIWANPDTDHAASQMKKVVSLDSVSLDNFCKKAKNDIALHFSPERVGKLIESRLPIIIDSF